MKPLERDYARRLRQRGASIKEIAATLGVSSSSVSRWVRDIELTATQQAALAARNPFIVGHPAGAQARAVRARAARRRWQAEGRALARRGDDLHRAGCMLYWAEGTKARNRVSLANADRDLLRLFCEFLHRCYRVRDEQLRLACNCHLDNGVSLEQIERYWLEALDLPTSCLLRSTVNVASRASQGKRHTLVYGTATVSVSSTQIVQSIYGAIQEYGGFERPAWLG